MKLSTEDIAKALGVSPINTNANLSLNNISIDSINLNFYFNIR